MTGRKVRVYLAGLPLRRPTKAQMEGLHVVIRLATADADAMATDDDAWSKREARKAYRGIEWLRQVVA